MEYGPIQSKSTFPPLFESTLKYLDETLEWESNEPINRANILLEYDFIVVGAGSAGSVVASRLSEVGKLKVLFLINYNLNLYLAFLFFLN